MKQITTGQITEAVRSLAVRANCFLPPDVAMALECASEVEANATARAALEDLNDNFKYAAESGLPICQDTGMAVVFADIGQDVHISGGNFEAAVNEGIRLAYTTGGLRCSVVADPFRRVNTDDNTPAVIHTRLVSGDTLSLTVAPKGFGSENMSALRMFNPTDSVEFIEDFIIDAVIHAGSKPCPPIILGIGVGGTFEGVALAAKRALLRPVDTLNSDPFYAEMETRLLQKINATGIGAQGFGGRTTALAVNVNALPTHIAGLPVAINMCCHVLRHASASL
ncbi:MAG: fumarate hydratase [Oscillospiraceae bacterium]|jgi:fumarate hydratase subunit alpha|nr:fumarate hydratase [Oscillospiraceae bacterium]